MQDWVSIATLIGSLAGLVLKSLKEAPDPDEKKRKKDALRAAIEEAKKTRSTKAVEKWFAEELFK